MACRQPKRLKLLIEACVSDSLFSDELPTNVFKCFLEILKNCEKKTFYTCFSKDTRRRLKKFKKLVKYLLSGRNVEKRKKAFLTSGKKFQKIVNNYLLPDFFENCLDCD